MRRLSDWAASIRLQKTGANMEWIIALAVLVIIGFVGTLVSITMPKFKMMQKLVDALNLVSREILTGLSVIRAFGREQTEEERFDVANQNLKKTQLFTNRVMTFYDAGYDDDYELSGHPHHVGICTQN